MEDKPLKNIKNKYSIAVMGVDCYPPPYGGISIHVKRLCEYLQEKQVNSKLYDIGKIIKRDADFTRTSVKWLNTYLMNTNEDLLHYHGYEPNSEWMLKIIPRLAIFQIIRRKKVIITIHSFRYDVEPTFKNRLIFYILAVSSVHFIAVNPDIKEKLVKLGIKKENIEVIPGFIPPIVNDEEIKKIPEYVWNFIDKHHPVIAANAFKIAFFNGQDLYGIDLCVELCENLKKIYPNVGFVFCLPDIGDDNYFKWINARIREKKISNNFLFVLEQNQLYPIIMKSDVFIRPTNTDGYSLSIAEALYFNIPTISSDVCDRPPGTILFENRDLNDLTQQSIDLLNNYIQRKQQIKSITSNNAEKIIGLYEKLMRI